jgi:hypothetical protein
LYAVVISSVLATCLWNWSYLLFYISKECIDSYELWLSSYFSVLHSAVSSFLPSVAPHC